MTTQNMTYIPNWDFMSHHQSNGIALSSLLGCCLIVGDFIQFKVNCWIFVENLLPAEQAKWLAQ
eukprot:scaffold256338_cov77-Attheya_sp.AAC.2